LALAGVLTFELVLANERATLDRALVRQRAHLASELQAGLPDDAAADPAAVRDEVARFLDVDPSSDQFVTMAGIDGERLVGRTQESDLAELAAGGGLDDAPVGVLGTAHTPEGDMRVLAAELRVGDDAVGRVVIAGPLAPARTEALAAAQRLGVAALLSLGVGIALVWVALGRVLRPLHQLTRTAAAAELVDLRARVPVDGDDEVADLAAEFNSMLDRLERAAADRERLLATISHELRTPLAVAQGHLELAAGAAPAPSETADAIAVARRELARVNRLVSDLLALGRSGQAGFLQRRDVTLAALAREVEVRVDGLGLDTVTVAPGSDLRVGIDADRVLQAILNCVVNAIEHNPVGTTADVTLELDGGADGEQVLVVRIVDDGSGLPHDIADTAFEPFVRAPSERDRLRSSGLGLAVVKAVAEAHGGTASATSSPSGTTVELRIPFDSRVEMTKPSA
jgi:signal transduction histidine kinase